MPANVHTLREYNAGGTGGGTAGQQSGPVPQFFGGQRQGQRETCTAMIGRWWKRLPAMTIAVFYVCVIVYILNLIMLFMGRDQFNEACLIPYFIFHNFGQYFWRAIAFNFVHTVNPLHIFFNGLFWLSVASFLERVKGTHKFIRIFLWCLPIVSLITIGLSWLLYQIPSDFVQKSVSGYGSCIAGLSGMLFCMLVIELYTSGISEASFFGCCMVPIKWYPWLLLILFQLISGSVSFTGHVSGILAGYVWLFTGLGEKVTPSDDKSSAADDKGGLSTLWLSKSNRYVKSVEVIPVSVQPRRSGGTDGNAASVSAAPRSTEPPKTSKPSTTKSEPKKKKEPEAFGGQGRTIGD